MVNQFKNLTNTTDTTSQIPRFWTDNFKTHDSEMCDCDTCKRYRKLLKQ